MFELEQVALDFGDERREIGLGKAEVGRWDAVMLDVRWNVLVMRMSGCQRRVVGVRP